MTMLVDDVMCGYEPVHVCEPEAVFAVLGAIGELVFDFSWALSVPMKRISEVRGWSTTADGILLDCKVDGLWMAFAL